MTVRPAHGVSYPVTALFMVGVFLLGTAFIASYVGGLHAPRPHRLPVAVVGPPDVTARTGATLRGDAFDLRTYPTAASARRAIQHRDVYGAYLPEQGRLLVTSAFGSATSGLLRSSFAQVAAANGQNLAVLDVVPGDAGDPEGLVPFYLVIGWIVSAYLVAAIVGLYCGMAALTRRDAVVRLLAFAVYAAATGAAGTLIVETGYGYLPAAHRHRRPVRVRRGGGDDRRREPARHHRDGADDPGVRRARQSLRRRPVAASAPAAVLADGRPLAAELGGHGGRAERRVLRRARPDPSAGRPGGVGRRRDRARPPAGRTQQPGDALPRPLRRVISRRDGRTAPAHPASTARSPAPRAAPADHHLCNECVALADAVIQEYKDKPVELRLPPWESLNDDQMLDHIPRVAAAIDQVETDLRAWVRELRRRGVTWSRIGEALGVTRQSAWERFSGED